MKTKLIPMTPAGSLVFRTWRFLFARSLRRPAPVGIIRNGSVKRVYDCAYCGASISMSAKYPMTARVKNFCNTHNVTHDVEMAAEISNA